MRGPVLGLNHIELIAVIHRLDARFAAAEADRSLADRLADPLIPDTQAFRQLANQDCRMGRAIGPILIFAIRSERRDDGARFDLVAAHLAPLR
jgi:hypothetical protein